MNDTPSLSPHSRLHGFNISLRPLLHLPIQCLLQLQMLLLLLRTLDEVLRQAGDLADGALALHRRRRGCGAGGGCVGRSAGGGVECRVGVGGFCGCQLVRLG